MEPIPAESRAALNKAIREHAERVEKDLIIACGRETFRTRQGNIQLFVNPDVDQGDAEHCLQRDSYTLWRSRRIE